MPIHAVTFALTSLETGRLVGFAAVCAEARYASVAWHGANRLERRHAAPAAWKAVEQEFALGLAAGPIERATVLANLVAGGRPDIVMQYVSVESVEVASPGEVANVLDAFLHHRATE